MIVENAEASNLNVKQAGKELKQANEYQKGSGMLLAMIYLVMAIILIMYDWVSAVYV